MIWRGHKTSLRDFRWPQLGPALFQLHTHCLKTNFGRYIIDFCTSAIIHNHLSFTCFDFLFSCLLKYRISYLSQLNFILRDEKHITSADQTPLTLVPSYKLSTKILFFHILCKFNNMKSIFFSLKKLMQFWIDEIIYIARRYVPLKTHLQSEMKLIIRSLVNYFKLLWMSFNSLSHVNHKRIMEDFSKWVIEF